MKMFAAENRKIEGLREDGKILKGTFVNIFMNIKAFGSNVPDRLVFRLTIRINNELG